MKDYYKFENVFQKTKGLADLLWAITAQSEHKMLLRFEGALILAMLASNIEYELTELLERDD